MLDIHSPCPILLSSSPTRATRIRSSRRGTYIHGKASHRHRPRDDQLGGRRDGRRRADRHRQPGGQPHHALGRGVCEGRRAPGRPGGQASGRDQSREHRVLGEAVHGPEPSRGRERGAPGAVSRRRRRQRRRGHRGARHALLAAGNLGDGAAQAEGGGRGLSRPAGQRRGHHRAGVLQRRAASGDQGRGPHCRPERAAHHQRADGGGAGLRARQERRTRRSRSTTSAAARSTSRSSKLARASSR